MKQQTTQPQKTLQDAIDAFVGDLDRRIRQGVTSGSTGVMHRVHLQYIVDGVDGTTPLAELTADLLDSWAVRELAGRRGGPISGRTLSKRLCTFRQVLAVARRRGWIAEVPALPRSYDRYRPRRQHLRDFAEFERLVGSLEPDHADWVWLATFSGQRPADVHRMRAYLDCDPFAEVPWMLLRNSKSRTAGVRVQMPAPLAARLRERFTREQLAPGQLVVKHWSKDARGAVLRRRARQLGIDVCRASDLRRTCGSWAAHHLGSLTVGLKDWLGHTSFQMLSLVYAHALPPGFEAVAQALGAMAPPAPPPLPEEAPAPPPPPILKLSSAGNGARRPPKKGMAAEGLPGPTAAGDSRAPAERTSEPPRPEKTRVADDV